MELWQAIFFLVLLCIMFALGCAYGWYTAIVQLLPACRRVGLVPGTYCQLLDNLTFLPRSDDGKSDAKKGGE